MNRNWGIAILVALVLAGVGVFTALFYFDSVDFKSFSFSSGDQKLFRKITVSREMGRQGLILEYCTDFLSDYPESPLANRVRVIAADAFCTRGDYPQARRFLYQILGDKKADPETLIEAAVTLGRVIKDSGVTEPLAHNYLEDIYIRVPAETRRELSVSLAYSFLYRKDYLNAARYFNEAGGEYALIGSARIYIDQGRYPEAIQEYLKYMPLYPDSRNYSGVTNAFLKQCLYYAGWLKAAGQTDQALVYYGHIIRLFLHDPYADDALVESGRIYAARKNYKDALAHFDRALVNKATNADDRALYEKAGTLYDTGRKTEAAKAYQEVAARWPQSRYAKEALDWVGVIAKEMQY